MKRFTVITLSCILLIHAFVLPSYAIDTQDFHIEEYTISDLYTLTLEEKRALLRKYKEVYNPFGIYENSNTSTVQPLWTSGDNEGTAEMETHELVTLEALLEVIQYLDTYDNEAVDNFGDATQMLFFCLNLAAASALPDQFWSGGITLFLGHFYNPETGENYLGTTSPTAKTNAVQHYNNARENLSNTQLITHDSNSTGVEELGKMLHFIQDACEPHHSSNVTALNPSHGEFEEHVNTNLEDYIACANDHTPAVMNAFSTMSVEEIVDLCATSSHQFIDRVNSVNDRTRWDFVAEECIDLSTSMSAIVIYKLLVEEAFI